MKLGEPHWVEDEWTIHPPQHRSQSVYGALLTEPLTYSSQQDMSYDAAMLFWRTVTQIFFREIRPRGAFNIPRDGPVIFVGAPHNNQVFPDFCLTHRIY